MTDASNASGGELPSQIAMRVGDLQGRFDLIRETYEYQDDGVAQLKQFMASQAVRPADRPYDGAALLAPIGTGKTELIRKLAAIMEADAPAGTIPVLHAEIPTSGSIDKVPNAILKALRELRPDAGRPEFRWQKAISRMKERQVKLLAVDEFDRATNRPTMSLGIANSLRERVMDAGVAPILFSGTKDAESLLLQADALYDRLVIEVPLEPLDWISKEDQEVAGCFLEAIDRRLVVDNLLRRSSGLKAKAEILVEASGGRVRQIMKFLRAGLGAAATRRASSITMSDLAIGWTELPLRDRGSRNPFGGGAK